MKKGIFEIPFGEAWIKSVSIKGGLVPLRTYQPALKRLIESGRAKPSFIFDRELRIEDAPEAYREFSDHDFIKSVIILDGEKNGHFNKGEESEEEAPTPRKRRRNGVVHV